MPVRYAQAPGGKLTALRGGVRSLAALFAGPLLGHRDVPVLRSIGLRCWRTMQRWSDWGRPRGIWEARRHRRRTAQDDRTPRRWHLQRRLRWRFPGRRHQWDGPCIRRGEEDIAYIAGFLAIAQHPLPGTFHSRRTTGASGVHTRIHLACIGQSVGFVTRCSVRGRVSVVRGR